MKDPISDPILEHAVAILRAAPAVAMPLPELAHRVGTLDTDGLARRLAADPRAVLLNPPELPGLSLPADRASAYRRALTAAGVRPARRVALVRRTPVPAAGVAGLLRATTAQLLEPAILRAAGPALDADRLAELAERTNRALRTIR